MFTQTNGKLVLMSIKILYFVFLLKLKFNPVLKRLTKKCTIMMIKNFYKMGFIFWFWYCMSYILSVYLLVILWELLVPI